MVAFVMVAVSFMFLDGVGIFFHLNSLPLLLLRLAKGLHAANRHTITFPDTSSLYFPVATQNRMGWIPTTSLSVTVGTC